MKMAKYSIRPAEKKDAPILEKMCLRLKKGNRDLNLRGYIQMLAKGSDQIHVSVATHKETGQVAGVMFFPSDEKNVKYGTGLLIEEGHRDQNISTALALHGLASLHLQEVKTFKVQNKTNYGFWGSALSRRIEKGTQISLTEAPALLSAFMNKYRNFEYVF